MPDGLPGCHNTARQQLMSFMPYCEYVWHAPAVVLPSEMQEHHICKLPQNHEGYIHECFCGEKVMMHHE
jgi:hypothetical protein